MKSLNFRDDQDLKKLLRDWHDGLTFQREDRALLERASSIEKVETTSAFMRLYSKLQAADYKVFRPALARTVGVLGQIRSDLGDQAFGRLLGSRLKLDRIRALEGRRPNPDLLLKTFVALVRQVGRKAPLLDTADVVYWWDVRKSNFQFFYDIFCSKGE